MKVLVVAAHADDEVLGCGGTIARHILEGDDVRVLIMTDGVSSRSMNDEIAIKVRMSACEGALKILGVKDWEILNFQDNRMDSVPLLDVIQTLEPIISDFGPHRVYTHHAGDLNIDHKITNQAVLTACRPVPNSVVKEIFNFEVMSSTEWSMAISGSFNPTVFINISEYFEFKLRALRAYDQEMRPYPHSRSYDHLTALARHRGSSVGVEFAESYHVCRLLF